jgi:hypothetical protein
MYLVCLSYNVIVLVTSCPVIPFVRLLAGATIIFRLAVHSSNRYKVLATVMDDSDSENGACHWCHNKIGMPHWTIDEFE